MNRFILLIIIQFTVGIPAQSQHKIPDGLYLLEELDVFGGQAKQAPAGKALIRFNPWFTSDNPDDYNPLLIRVNEFVPFELAMPPIAQRQNRHEQIMLLKLSEPASLQLRQFTSKYLYRQVVIVINGEAVAVHQVAAPVTSGLLHISRCAGYTFRKLSELLTNSNKR